MPIYGVRLLFHMEDLDFRGLAGAPGVWFPGVPLPLWAAPVSPVTDVLGGRGSVLSALGSPVHLDGKYPHLKCSVAAWKAAGCL